MRHRLSKLFFAVLCTLLLNACGQEAKDTHPDQWVSKRRAVFKQMTKTFEPIGMAARGRTSYNPREFNTAALELQQLATQPWSLFPPDSNYPPTLAKPAVWDSPAEFQQAQDRFQASVTRLVQAAQGSDVDASLAAANAVERNCKACHDQFRSSR